MRLVENRRTDAALWLIDSGADTEATDQTGHRALDYATAHGLTEVVARLSQNGSDATDSRDAEGNTPLHQAVYNDQAEVVRTLLAVSKAMRAKRRCWWRADAGICTLPGCSSMPGPTQTGR